MLKSNPKSKTDGPDPFDKKKLAEEAKKDQEKLEEAKRQQDRSKLQLQISNRERELDKLEAGLRVKEGFLVESKRKAEDAKKAVFLLDGQIKKQEGGSKYLNDTVVTEDKKETVSEAELAKIRSQIDLVEREKKLLEAKYNNSRSSLIDLERIISSLKSELDKAIYEADSSKKQRAAEETELNRKRTEKASLEQKYKSLEAESKQTVNRKFRVTKSVSQEGKKINEEKQELFLRKREVEELEANNQVVMREIGNLQREINRLTAELHQKESLLLETRRRVEDAKKAVFLLDGQIKKQEGGVSYLSQDASAEEAKTSTALLDLDRARAEGSSLERDISSLESKHSDNLRSQSDFEVRVNRLKDELRRVTTEADAFRKEAAKKEEEVAHKKMEEERLAQSYKNLEAVSKQIAGKQFGVKKSVQAETKSIKEEKQELFLRKRIAEQLERDLAAAIQVLTMLNRDKDAKEREIANLKRERDQI